MTFLPENHDLRTSLIPHSTLLTPRFIILSLDALLELEHHGTGGIDDLDVVATGELVGLRGFAMGTQQHLHIVELAHLLMIDGDEPHLAEAFTLHTIVHDITETIELGSLGQFFFGLLNSGGHPEAEATAFIYFDLDHIFLR